ncbi:MAG: hypothetical protein GOVbin1923_32 [Prokaryotic dsDNA virus sp.]|nr:MAG: hypothetical protein GOVbin1923_32 [Prokaryotic dsDNA virus sp.]|tara:strand:- start:8955 stop:9326 length:372 start_codon:yes stop_codon:yes gene_type:complete
MADNPNKDEGTIRDFLRALDNEEFMNALRAKLGPPPETEYNNALSDYAEGLSPEEGQVLVDMQNEPEEEPPPVETLFADEEIDEEPSPNRDVLRDLRNRAAKKATPELPTTYSQAPLAADTDD